MSLQLLSRLKERGIRLWTEEGRLLFQAPKEALTPDLREELKRNKAELLEILSQSGVQDGTPPLEPVPRDQTLPLSFAQERLWFLDQLEPGNAWYNILSPIQLEGDLDCAALQGALCAIVQRHEVLRSSFPVQRNRPVQHIRADANLPLPLIDLSGLADADRTSQRDRLIRQELKRPFDLSRGPLIRAALVVLEGSVRSSQFAVSETENGERRTEGRAESRRFGLQVPGSRSQNPESGLRNLEPEAGSLKPGASPPSSVLRPPFSVLLLTLHHIVSDAWSSNILIRELAALYSAFANPKPGTLPPLRIQYADFAHWQRRWLTGAVLERQIGHWKRHLEGAPELLDLPVARPRPPLQSYRGFREAVGIPEKVSSQLRGLARQEGATLFMVLLGLFASLLSRYSGQKDVLVGSPIANRNRAEIEPLIGFFVNTLVLRTVFSERPTFRQVLRQLRETTLGAYAHQDLPFEKLVEELQPQRDVSHTPLFQVLFTLQNAPAPQLEVPGLRLEFLAPDKTTVGFDIDLTLHDRPDGVSGTLAAAADLFDRPTIRRLIRHLQALARSAVAFPDRRVFELPLLDEAESRQILLEWNDSAYEFPWGDSFNQRFREQAQRTPDACAAGFQEQACSYAELHNRSAVLAGHLQQRGVGPDSVVALLDQRRPELLIAILGVLKAGAAYLPLDPKHPAQRMALVLQQSLTPLVVAAFPLLNSLNQALKELPAQERPQVLCLEEALSLLPVCGFRSPVSFPQLPTANCQLTTD
ncbi:MAG: condensation domain-containing protein, partial [Acidobacteriota bacterium]